MHSTALLGLLQLADSSFPAGGFAHSSGLEQLVHEGTISSPEETVTFVRSLLRHSLATSDAPVVCASARATEREDCAAVVGADYSLFVMKSTSELRAASTSMGRRMVREASAHIADPTLHFFTRAVDAGETPGTHAAAFGVCAGSLGVDGDNAAAAFLLAAATSLLHAAMRLLPVSHRDVQAGLHSLHAEIALLAEQAAHIPLSDLRSFHFVQDMASMRHRTANVRLFAS